MSVGKIDRMSEDEEDIDVSIIPMEHRTKHGLMSPMTRHVLKKKQFYIFKIKDIIKYGKNIMYTFTIMVHIESVYIIFLPVFILKMLL